MEKQESRSIRYFSITPTDESWGVVVTTVGYQPIPPGSGYPRSHHPDSYQFDPAKGRILKEYQLVYITQGGGYFESASCRLTRIRTGTMILLFPGEWHTYYPDKATGWFEYWVGFEGADIESRVRRGFFSKKNPVYPLGISATIVSQYENIVHYAAEEKRGYQQLISGIVLSILGNVYYKTSNAAFASDSTVSKINEARIIMRRSIEAPEPPEIIARELGVSYSWFRQMFKRYTGQSPLQYQLHLKYLMAKELLERTDLTISEIAFRLSFENLGQFSSFFRKKEGMPPARYRKEADRTLKVPEERRTQEQADAPPR